MGTSKVAISLDAELLRRLDRAVKEKRFKSRSGAIQAAVREELERIEHRRLAEECRKLRPRAERAMAEEGLAAELEKWPEY